MLLIAFLSVFTTMNASAHDGCKGNSCCDSRGHHYGWWGHNGYIYGPDGCYARHKSACCGSEAKKDCCKSECKHTYSRARYYEDCCGRGHLHVVKCHKSDD